MVGKLLLLFPLVIALAVTVPAIARSDEFANTVQLARQLASGKPSTVWEADFPDENADFIQFVAPGRLLVGAVESDARLGVPGFKSLLLYDTRSGRKVWDAPRPNLSQGRYAPIATQPLIVVLGSNAATMVLIALDPLSGARAWEQSVRNPLAQTVSDDQQQLFVLSAEDARRQLIAIDLRTGQRSWSRELSTDVVDDKGRVRLRLDAAAVYVAGRKLAKVARQDGRIVWVSSPPSLQAGRGMVAATPRGPLVWDAASLSLFDSASGKPAWTRPVQQGGIKLVAPFEHQVLQVIAKGDAELLSATGTADRVEALDAASGKLLWSRELDGAVVSPLAMEQGSLIFSSEDEVLALDSASGAVRFQRLLPASFRLASPTEYDPAGQPDLLQVRDGKLFIARESAGLIAYALADGRELWRQENYVLLAGTYPFSLPSRTDRLTATLLLHKVPVVRAPPGLEYYTPQPSEWMQGSQARSTALEGVRRDEHKRRLELNNYLYSTGIKNPITGGSPSILAASVELSLTLSNALHNIALRGMVSRVGMEIEHAASLHNSAFQGAFYARPFIEARAGGAQGVTLVNLETGRRNDLVLSPFVQAISANGIEIPQIAIDPENGRLVAVGIGLRPEHYREYVRWKVRLPRPNLLAYDLSTISFVDKNPSLEKRHAAAEAVAANSVEQFLNAARVGNAWKVRRLLDKGVDVNTRTPHGHTALIMAADAKNDALVRFLLSRRASVNTQASGQTALDFAADPAIQRMLRDAGGKKGAELR